ncbi:hypothetical protein HY968_03645 [Candidatus Kaiserbacteria bacterium]|nr:hypothetical protein [Candidatus Kaiserbacteria bacterium]
MNRFLIVAALLLLSPLFTHAAESPIKDCRVKANDDSYMYEGKLCAGALSTQGTCKSGACVLDSKDVVPIDSSGAMIPQPQVPLAQPVDMPTPGLGVSILDAALQQPFEQAFGPGSHSVDQARIDSAAQRLQEAFDRLQNDPANYSTHFDEVRAAQEDLARAKRLMDNPAPALKDYIREFIAPRITPTELVPGGEKAPVRLYEWINNFGSTFGATQVAENPSGATLTDVSPAAPTFEERYNDFLARLDQLDKSAAETEKTLLEYQKRLEAEIRGLDKMIALFPRSGGTPPTPAWLDTLDKLLGIGPSAPLPTIPLLDQLTRNLSLVPGASAPSAPPQLPTPFELGPAFSVEGLTFSPPLLVQSLFSSSPPASVPDTVVLQQLPWTGETNLTEADLQAMLDAEKKNLPLPPIANSKFSSSPPQMLPPTVAFTPLPNPAPIPTIVAVPLPSPIETASPAPSYSTSLPSPSAIGTSLGGTMNWIPFLTALLNFYNALNGWFATLVSQPSRSMPPAPITPKPISTSTPATSTPSQAR